MGTAQPPESASSEPRGSFDHRKLKHSQMEDWKKQSMETKKLTAYSFGEWRYNDGDRAESHADWTWILLLFLGLSTDGNTCPDTTPLLILFFTHPEFIRGLVGRQDFLSLLNSSVVKDFTCLSLQ